MSFDWFFSIIASIITGIHAGLSHIFGFDSGWSWGLSIFVLTVAMRILIFPLFVKQIQSSRKMQELNPQIQALRKKYKNDKQRMNQEMMKLYQEAGANPLGGCLPLLVQMPIFFGLFRVLRAISSTHVAAMRPGQTKYGMSKSIIESAQNAHILGAKIPSQFIDAFHTHSASAMIVTGCAVLISSTTTFLTMRTSVGRSMASGQMADNPMMQSQKYLVYLSPLFGLFGLTLPLGVLIYWVTTNSWTLAQSHYIYKRYPMPGTAEADKAKAGAGAGKSGAAKTGAAKTGAGAGKSNGKTSGKKPAGSGILGKTKKAEEEPQDTVPEEPKPKVVRQQPTRQSRSKRKR